MGGAMGDAGMELMSIVVSGLKCRGGRSDWRAFVKVGRSSNKDGSILELGLDLRDLYFLVADLGLQLGDFGFYG